MDVLAMLPAFLVAVLLMAATPGPAMALILRRAALRGLRGAVPTVLGLELGLYLWALAAGAGLAALVAASEVAYLVLRVAGAGVLLYLGLRAWRTAWRDGGTLPDRGPEQERLLRRGWWAAFGEGLLVQLANPKAAVFMLAFYPQFVPADGPVLATTAALALLQVVVETGLYLALAAAVARAGRWFRRPRVRRRLEAASGTVLVALGLRVAVSGR
ncbi:LysE family translocator [Blastococcus sp. KM273129]|uniref:LysE family translocator n=1 Tax=Blastococcus sp. KM273129 TaxID=2570315 RepID=UPI001F395BB9|nr:LysE family translocator [Blastococcus sp. KM273129]MCF6734149.1 LysE family translocator [Blastococcus sp. KM273129]